MIFRTCSVCGCALDPGERCDCEDEKKEAAPLHRERPLGKTPVVSLAARSVEVKEPRRCWNG